IDSAISASNHSDIDFQVLMANIHMLDPSLRQPYLINFNTVSAETFNPLTAILCRMVSYKSLFDCPLCGSLIASRDKDKGWIRRAHQNKRRLCLCHSRPNTQRGRCTTYVCCMSPLDLA